MADVTCMLASADCGN